jgi:hypothetical protein
MTKNEYIVIPIATITRRRIPKDLVLKYGIVGRIKCYIMWNFCRAEWN